MWHKRFVVGLAIFTGLAVAACGDDDPVEVVATVEITPAAETVAQMDTALLQATVRSAAGTVLEGRQVHWESSDEYIARHIGQGRFIGENLGTVTITATSEGQEGTGTLEVVHRPVVALEFMSRSFSGQAGDTVRLHASALDSRGAEVFGAPINWGTRDAGTAIVSDEGLVTLVSAGSTYIVAGVPGTAGQAADSARIDVRFPYEGREPGSFTVRLLSDDLGDHTFHWQGDAIYREVMGRGAGHRTAMVGQPPGRDQIWETDEDSDPADLVLPDSMFFISLTRSGGTGRTEFEHFNPGMLGRRDPSELARETATLIVKQPNGETHAYVARDPAYVQVRAAQVPQRPGLILGAIEGDVTIYKAVGYNLERDADGDIVSYLTGDTASIHAGFHLPYMHWPVAYVDMVLAGGPVPGVLQEVDGIAYRLGPELADTVELPTDPPSERITPYRAHIMDMWGLVGAEHEETEVELTTYIQRSLIAETGQMEEFGGGFDDPAEWPPSFSWIKYSRDDLGEIVGGSITGGFFRVENVIPPLDSMFGLISGQVATTIDVSASSGVPGQTVALSAAATGTDGLVFALPVYWQDWDQIIDEPPLGRLQPGTLRELNQQVNQAARMFRR